MGSKKASRILYLKQSTLIKSESQTCEVERKIRSRSRQEICRALFLGRICSFEPFGDFSKSHTNAKLVFCSRGFVFSTYPHG